MLGRVLTEEQRRLVADERKVLDDLRLLLSRLDVGEQEQRALGTSIRQLDELFLLVIVGEFNSGKSAFVNALLGERVLEEGVTPTTSRIHRVHYGEELSRRTGEGGIEEVEAPLELLREIIVVDTPGTNAIDRSHEALTRDFVPRADMVLFVTSADRPFTESERAFLQQLREWGKKVVVVVNKVDILEQASEVDTIESFITENFERLLGFTPEIFPVSAKRALAEKRGTPGPTASGFDRLEHYIVDRLDEGERLRLKLGNPLGVGRRVAADALAATGSQLELLRQDFRTLADLEGQLEQYRVDLRREFELRLGDVERRLQALQIRGDEFFDETLRLGRIPDLLNKSKIEAQFSEKVIGDLPQQVEAMVSDIIDWMVDSELRQWQSVSSVVQARREAHGERLGSGLGAALESNRRKLLDSLGRASQRAVDSYDRRKEANRLAESVQLSVAGAALLEVGAIGLGSIVAIASSTVVDVTGVLAATALAALGLFVLPARKRQAKAALRDRIDKLRTTLMAGLRLEFESELERSVSRLEGAAAPYTRFVRGERERLGEAREALEAIVGEMTRLQSEIDQLG